MFGDTIDAAKRADDLVEYRFLVPKTHIWTLQMRTDVPRDQALLKRQVCYGARAHEVKQGEKGRGHTSAIDALLTVLEAEGHNMSEARAELTTLVKGLGGW
jgi:hypothetical protein